MHQKNSAHADNVVVADALCAFTQKEQRNMCFSCHLVYFCAICACLAHVVNVLSLALCSTVRTWDVNLDKKHKAVFKPRSLQGKKVTPTCCAYSRDGKLIAAGCQDGTIQIWDRNLSVSPYPHLRRKHPGKGRENGQEKARMGTGL